MGRTATRVRGLGGRIALAAALVLASSAATAAPRAVEIAWRYPAGSAPYTGIALYHAATPDELVAGVNLTRVDLGLPPADDQGVVRVVVEGFDDERNYYLALRVYDEAGGESANSQMGIVTATAPPPPVDPIPPTDPPPTDPPPPLLGPTAGETFESYGAGQDPDDWEDSASGSTATGDAALFETAELSDATIAFGTQSTEADIHSHYLTSQATAWSSYDFSGRIVSQTLNGEAGVTVLSRFPASLAYYRLARSGMGAFSVSVRGGDSLVCAGTTSTGVAAEPGVWLRFRVRVTRFDSRNRIRARVYPDGSAEPADWQVDCWDASATPFASGTVGLFASSAPNTWWDDLKVTSVPGDGAPPGYQPASQPPAPPPADAYTSRSSLVHWWAPGRDPSAVGRDFAWRATKVDAATPNKGVGKKDVIDAARSTAFVDLDGSSESLGNKKLQRYGIGDTWSLSAWVRPDAMGRKKKARHIVDLNGELGKRSQSRISLVLDSGSHFAVEVSDAAGRVRSLAATTPIDEGGVGQRWYHVVAVKTGDDSLALYVNGNRVAFTDVGVPQQADVERALRVGARVKGAGYGFSGGVASVAMWRTALAAGEVRVLAKANRTFDPR